MKNILLKLVFLLFISLTCKAYDTNTTDELDQEIALPKQKSIFLSYEEIPQRIYVGELFSIKVKAIIANDEFEDISTSFEQDANLTLVNPESKWQWFSDNIFYNTFFMKLTNPQTPLPKIYLSILKNGQVLESEMLESAQTRIVKLNSDKFFSQVIAKSLKIDKFKTTQFNDESYIIVIEMEAEESNLADFHLEWVQRDGIDSSQENLPFSKIFYYAIVPNHQKHFNFTFFNTQRDEFQKISLPIILDDDSVSTQIDLNPKENSLEVYKNILYLFFLLLFVILFFKRKKNIYILFILFIIALFLYEKAPINSIKIATQTQVKILPTKNSTIFYTLDRPMYAEKLAKKNEYIKILLPNGKIGWIKEENVLKN